MKDQKNNTKIGKINLESFKMSNNTNDFNLQSIEEYHSNFTTIFGIKIRFERNNAGITGILISYHFMCALLVLVGNVNFLIDPKVVPGRSGLLVTIFLVLANFFSGAQVINKQMQIFSGLKIKFGIIFSYS